MPRRAYNKSVRDQIPERIQQKGQHPQTRTLSSEEYYPALLDKLEEEGRELREAKARNKVFQELADVLEVLDAITVYHGFSAEEVRIAQERKRSERGGFAGKVFLEYVDEPEV